MVTLHELLQRIGRRASRLVRFLGRALTLKKYIAPTVLVVLLLAIPLTAHAGIKETTIVIIGNVVEFFVELFGKLLIAVIDVLVKVAQYNDFADSDAVNIGWVVSRDLANMLFIVALIVIAFGTIVGWEQYKYNRLLGKLALTAVIVNFSKAISLFLIDFSQVVMLTFVNAFRDVAAGNLTTAFGIRALLTYAESSTSVDISLSETVMIYALAIILLIIALLVTLTLVVVLVRRIISLWILIILSPLAFIASVMPGGVGSFNGQWWSKFGKEMFTGPVLAFFLWLTFSIIFLTSGQGVEQTATIIDIGQSGEETIIVADETEVQAVASEIGSSRNIFNFLAAIVLLIHSLSIAKEAGGFAGQFAGAVSGKINAAGTRALRGAANLTKKTAFGAAGLAVAPVKGVAQRAGYGIADSVLSAGEKIGVLGIGNRIGVARGRLEKRRQRAAEEQARDLSYVSKDVLMRMANGRSVTEKGRAMQKVAMEKLIDQGDADDLTAEARSRYRKYIGYQEKAEMQVDENGNPIRDDDGNIKYTLKRNARDGAGYTRLRKLLKDHPEYWFDGHDQKDDSLRAAVEGKFDSELNKFKKDNWMNFDVDAIRPGPQSTDQIRQKLWDKFQEQFGSTFTTDANGNVTSSLRWWNELDPTKRAFFLAGRPGGQAQPAQPQGPAAQPLMDVDDRHRRQFEREQATRERLGIGGNSAQVDDMLEYARAQKSGIETDGTKFASVAPKIDSRIQEGESIDEVIKSLEDYKGSKESMSDVEYEEARKSLELYMKAQAEQDADLPTLIGAENLENRVEQDIQRAQETGGSSFARLAVDFDKLGLSGAGAYASGDQKDQLALGIEQLYRQQLVDEMTQARKRVNQTLTAEDQKLIEERVQGFRASIGKAEKLALVNTKRKGYTLPHVMRHENAHAEIERIEDQNPQVLEELFATMTAEQQKAVVDDYAKELGIQALPEADKRKIAMKEYFTEGLANYGRTKDAVGPKLDDSMALALKASGVKLRGYQEKALPKQDTSREEYDQVIRERENELKKSSDELDSEFAKFLSRHDLEGQQLLEDKALNLESLQNGLIQKELQEVWNVPPEEINTIIGLHRAKNKAQRRLKSAQDEYRVKKTVKTPKPKTEKPREAPKAETQPGDEVKRSVENLAQSGATKVAHDIAKQIDSIENYRRNNLDDAQIKQLLDRELGQIQKRHKTSLPAEVLSAKTVDELKEKMTSFLKGSFSLAPADIKHGDAFDIDFMDAVDVVETNDKNLDGKVSDVINKAYRLDEGALKYYLNEFRQSRKAQAAAIRQQLKQATEKGDKETFQRLSEELSTFEKNSIIPGHDSVVPAKVTVYKYKPKTEPSSDSV